MNRKVWGTRLILSPCPEHCGFASPCVEVRITKIFSSVLQAGTPVHKIHNSALLSHSNPIFLPTAYSPAFICFGRERGWWITCNYPTVLKGKNINMNSPDDFIIYFRLHKIIKVFLFIFVYNFFELDTWSNLQDKVQASSCMFHSRKWFLSFHLSQFCCKPCNPLLIFFYFALWNASSHLAFSQGQKMMVFPSFLNFCSSHCPQAEWWDFSCKTDVSAVFLHSPSYLISKGCSC